MEENNNNPSIIEELRALRKLTKDGVELSGEQAQREKDLAELIEKQTNASTKSAKRLENLDALIEKQESIDRVTKALQESNAQKAKSDKEESKTLKDIASSTADLFTFGKASKLAEKRKISKVDRETREELTGEKGFDFSGMLKFLKLDGLMTFFGFFKDLAKFLGPIIATIGTVSLSSMGVGIAIVIGAISAIKGSFDRIKKVLGDKDSTWWDVISAGIVGALEGILQIPAKIMDFAKNILSKITKFLFGEDNAVSKFLDSFSFSEMVTKAADWAQKALSDVGNKIIGAVSGAIEAIKKFFSWEEMKKSWESMKEDINKVGLIPVIGKVIKNIFSSMNDWFTEKGAKVKEFLDTSFAAVKKVFTDLWDGVTDFFTGVSNWFSETSSSLKQKLGDGFTAFKTFFTDLWEGVTGWVKQLGEDIGAVFDTVAEVFNSAGEWFSDTFSWENIKAILQVPVDYVKGFFNNLGGIFTSIGDWFVEMFSWENIKSGVKGIADVISNAAKLLSDLVKEGLAWMAGKLKFWDKSTPEQKAEKEAEKERKKETKQQEKEQKQFAKDMKKSGVIETVDKNMFGLGGREVVEQDKLQGLSDDQLSGLYDYAISSGNEEMMQQVQDEGSRRKEVRANHTGFEKFTDEGIYNEIDKLQGPGRGTSPEDQARLANAIKEAENRGLMGSSYNASTTNAVAGSGTMEAAMKHAAETPGFYDIGYTGSLPSAVIAGTQQQAVAQSDEMRAGQAVYDENKGPVRQGGDTNTSVNAPTTNNQTINNTYTQGSQPSTRDDTDQMYIFRATGTSR